MHDFPGQYVGQIQELAVRLLDSRKPGTDLGSLARDLLTGFHDLCTRNGLDGLLVELGEMFSPLAPPGSAEATQSLINIADRTALAEHPASHAALVAQLGAHGLDGGGPRNAKPRQIAESIVTALQLTIAEEVDRSIALDGALRATVVAAIAAVIDVELAVPRIRETIITVGRAALEERYRSTFDKVVANLDERGMRVDKVPKVPLDALQAVQTALAVTRTTVIGQMCRAGIDRARDLIAAANPEAAARIDAPITHKLTPRDVAVLRACDPRVPRIPSAVAATLLEAITETARLVWRAPERPVRTYGIRDTYAIGDVLEHPKFGRGSVTAVAGQRVDVEFPDGKVTLVHAK